MPEERDPGRVWRGQPEERIAMTLEMFMNRRRRELASKTRLEILVSIGAALFFVTVMWWSFRDALGPIQRIGVAAVVAWVGVTLWWMLRRGRGREDAASAGVEFYYKELERRRDHLRNSWLWLGPLVLAILLPLLTFIGRELPDVRRLKNAAPFTVLLVVWVVVGVWSRRKQARELQREIDELAELRR